MGEDVPVTDSCQENESAVCQPTTQRHTQRNGHAYRVRDPGGGGQSTQCLVKGRKEDLGNTSGRSEYLFDYETVQTCDLVSAYSQTRL